MSCCVSLVYYLKKKLNNFGNDFDEFLNKILEIDSNNKNNEYNLINVEDLKENDINNHISINIPIENDYDLI